MLVQSSPLKKITICRACICITFYTNEAWIVLKILSLPLFSPMYEIESSYLKIWCFEMYLFENNVKNAKPRLTVFVEWVFPSVSQWTSGIENIEYFRFKTHVGLIWKYSVKVSFNNQPANGKIWSL